ncbi:MAG: phenylalanine--tRNA ligase subunit beta [Firmicutes bacterium]|nr:phenylalanine--tRNA ligase subunit beta [Bacillota bacterium]
MRVSLEWLREYVKIDIPVEELAEKLTMAGIAVEDIEDQAAAYQGMVVAKVLSLEKHPKADNLMVGQLDCGAYGTKQALTAAKNVRQGDLIPVALPGAKLPDGKVIGEAELKGMISQVMMCSGEELGLEKESTGIWIFNGDLKPGFPVAEALGATDRILVLELTANRSDCLGMIGVAREVAAVLGTEYTQSPTSLREEGAPASQLAAVEIADPELCPRYTARVVTDVKIGPSPEWMQRRLKAAGVRPISNIVDITNYVMLEYNQPLHAFDYDRIAGHKIIVRRAKQGEKLMTLDEVERVFEPGNLLIADPESGLCVAGVMGGCTSEVTQATTNILLEAAYFHPGSIRRTAKMLKMKTEASYRFERGIDPEGVPNGLNRAARLIEDLGIGKVAKGIIDQYPGKTNPVVIKTTAAKINGWLGTQLKADEIKTYLERTTCQVKTGAGDSLEVTVPSYRRDISHMADLAEEVARLYGYNRIPSTYPAAKQVGERTVFQKFQQDLRRLLQGNGLSEVMTYSLYAKNVAERLGLAEDDPMRQTVDLMVPLSEEQAVMRTNLVHSLLETIAYNVKRRQSDLGIFEMARVYYPKPGSVLPDEPLHLGIGLLGRLAEKGWNQDRPEVDFYDLKGILEAIFSKFKLPDWRLERSTRSFLHPGQAAEVLAGGQPVGFFGRIHPDVLKRYEINQPVFMAEIDLTRLETMRNPVIVFEPLPKFPAVERDLALVLPVQIPARKIMDRIREIAGNLAERVELFDVYQGNQVPEGMRSLAFSLSYRSKDRTLNDDEVNRIQERLLKTLRAEYGAEVRA